MTALAFASRACGGFGASGFTPGRSLRRGDGASRPLLPEQIGEREAGDAAAELAEQLTPRVVSCSKWPHPVPWMCRWSLMFLKVVRAGFSRPSRAEVRAY